MFANGGAVARVLEFPIDTSLTGKAGPHKRFSGRTTGISNKRIAFISTRPLPQGEAAELLIKWPALEIVLHARGVLNSEGGKESSLQIEDWEFR
jgi:hypothetical protein